MESINKCKFVLDVPQDIAETVSVSCECFLKKKINALIKAN